MLSDWLAYERHRNEIESLLDPRCHTIEWLDAEIQAGHVKLFGCLYGVIAVELRNYPAGAVELHGLVAAGELEAVKRLIERAETWARGEGAIFAGIESRPGWVKAMKPHGYEPHQVIIRKELV